MIGFSGMLRPSEIMNLTFEDLVKTEDHRQVVLEGAPVLLTRSTPSASNRAKGKTYGGARQLLVGELKGLRELCPVATESGSPGRAFALGAPRTATSAACPCRNCSGLAAGRVPRRSSTTCRNGAQRPSCRPCHIGIGWRRNCWHNTVGPCCWKPSTKVCRRFEG